MTFRRAFFLSAVLLGTVTAPALAVTTVAWDWTGDEAQIDRFEFAAIDPPTGTTTQLHVIASPSARSFPVADLPAPLAPASFYVIRACGPDACSDWSNTVYFPTRPGRPRIQ